MPAAPRPWSWLHQVHGADVVVVDHPGAAAGTDADALVTATVGAALVVRTADCAPLVLLGDHTVGVVHAGWRGLVAGVVGASLDAIHDLGDEVHRAVLGPCIRAGCYEFDGPERALVIDRFGPAVGAQTTWGTPAIDVPAVVRLALRERGVTELVDEAGCTACDTRWYSHRARQEAERFATVAWLEGS